MLDAVSFGEGYVPATSGTERSVNNVVGGSNAPRQCFFTGNTNFIEPMGSKNIIMQNLNCPGGTFTSIRNCSRWR